MTPRPPHAVPLSDIVDGLIARVDQLVREILPAGIREGSEWCVGSLAGEKGRSCKIHIGTGPRAGVWKDFSTGEKGDALDLVRHVLFRGDKAKAILWAKAWLGYGGDARNLSVTRRAVAAKKAKAAETIDDDTKRKRARAQRMWLSAQETISSTLAEHYLATRGIDFSVIGRYPRSLRFAPALEAWQAKPNSDRMEMVGKFPAMLAAIVGPDGTHVATHRTFLARRPDGTVGKAPLRDAKMTLGGYVGGCIRLFKPLLENGRRAPSLKDAPEGSGVYVTEGIEDGLTVAMADQSQYIVVAVSGANMGSLWLPPSVKRITIVGQNDTEAAALKALDRAIEFHQKAGRTVYLTKPSAQVKDVNDLLNAGGAA